MTCTPSEMWRHMSAEYLFPDGGVTLYEFDFNADRLLLRRFDGLRL